MKIFFFILLVASGLFFPGYVRAADSILAVHTANNQLVKANRQEYVASMESKLKTQGVERLKMGRFTLLLNPTSHGQYELQLYLILSYGKKQVSSVYSSMYEGSIEYGYSYNKTTHRITRDHYTFPPNSLTGWGTPGDFETISEFDWGSKFPFENCSQTFHSLEQYGREYMEAGCFPGREAAITFAKKFVAYLESSRGL